MQPAMTMEVNRTVHVPSKNKLSQASPQNIAIPGSKQVRLMILDKAKCIKSLLTESDCLAIYSKGSSECWLLPTSLFPLFCQEVVFLVDSLAYFYVASSYLINFMGIRFKLSNLLIIISEGLPFFILIAFSTSSFLLTLSTPSIWYVIYDVQIDAV